MQGPSLGMAQPSAALGELFGALRLMVGAAQPSTTTGAGCRFGTTMAPGRGRLGGDAGASPMAARRGYHYHGATMATKSSIGRLRTRLSSAATSA
jgi:hypothetical protein